LRIAPPQTPSRRNGLTGLHPSSFTAGVSLGAAGVGAPLVVASGVAGVFYADLERLGAVHQGLPLATPLNTLDANLYEIPKTTPLTHGTLVFTRPRIPHRSVFIASSSPTASTPATAPQRQNQSKKNAVQKGETNHTIFYSHRVLLKKPISPPNEAMRLF
jgi:hypothetical protein